MDAPRVAYSLVMVVATLAAGIIYRATKTTDELKPIQKWGIAIGGLIGATFAAKLPFVFSQSANGSLLAAWLSDGKTVLWGLAGGYVGVEIAKWSLFVKQRTGDRFVVPVAVAIAIGRLGCLFYGCCWGIPTDQSWGVHSVVADEGELLRHPAPLYESMFHLGFAAIAWIGIHGRIFRSHWMLIYLIAYSLFRFVSEYWREEPIVAAGLTFYQISSIVIGLAFTAVLLARWLHQSDSSRSSVEDLGESGLENP